MVNFINEGKVKKLEYDYCFFDNNTIEALRNSEKSLNNKFKIKNKGREKN